MNNKVYFDNVTQIGNLYLECVFFEFESEPILFTCVDDDKKLYFCLCSEIRYGQKWIIMECSVAKIKALIEKRIDIANAFLSEPYVTMVDMDLQGNEKSYRVYKDEIDRLDLPKIGTHLQCQTEKANNYLWFKQLESFYDDSRTKGSFNSTINKTEKFLGFLCDEYEQIKFNQKRIFYQSEKNTLTKQPSTIKEKSTYQKPQVPEEMKFVSSSSITTEYKCLMSVTSKPFCPTPNRDSLKQKMRNSAA